MGNVATIAAADPLGALLAGGGVRPVFQPIVELDGGANVGFEALARGPRGHDLETPAALFAAAGKSGRVAELDRACRHAALQGGLDAGVRPPLSLFVNIEPESTRELATAGASDVLTRALETFPVFFEVTERALTEDPAELLEAVARMRTHGCGIALDDVGADRRSLALMPLLRPDVIKLDLSLVQDRPSTEIAAIAGAVQAQAERSGATVLAEGIEEPEHVMTARALGATLGQGFLFGRPAPLRGLPALPGHGIELAERLVRNSGTPYELAARDRAPRLGRKDLLIAVSKQLEQMAVELGGEGILIGTFQTADRFTPDTRRRYARLARQLAFVGAIAEGLEGEPEPGVRAGSLAANDPLRKEWAVVVIGPHVAAALSAVDLGDDGPEDSRRFEFVTTYERHVVVEIVRRLFERVELV